MSSAGRSREVRERFARVLEHQTLKTPMIDYIAVYEALAARPLRRRYHEG